jgi:hypothetical protein
MGAEANMIWRFFLDDARKWRWQQVSVSRVVVADSQGSFDGYEACVADAEAQGYVFVPSKTKAHRPRGKES